MPLTVCVTGAGGFIARHICAQLLAGGHAVVATARSSEKGARLCKDLEAAGIDTTRLSHATLDLSEDTGWADALSGCDALMHTASPFPMTQPKNPDDLIRPAVDGTRRALDAAATAGVTRVIVTSSIVSMIYTTPRPDGVFGPEHWNDGTDTTLTPYVRSKTLAERAAWELAERLSLDLTTVCPGFVLGAPIGDSAGTSLGVVARILSAKDPMNPRAGFCVADVEDVARAHVEALETPASVGKRLIAAAEYMTFSEMARAIMADQPDRKLVTREAPDWLVRILALFDPSIRVILKDLGKTKPIDTSETRDLLGMTFTPGTEAVVKAARALG